jgi:hypothetical protein
MSEIKDVTVIEPENLPQVAPSAPLPSTQNAFSSKEAFDQATRYSMMLSKSNIVPESYQGKPENCFVALDMANRMGLSPLVVMQNLYIVKGKPSWSGQSCKMMIENCGKFKNIKHVYIGKKGEDSYGCYLTGIRVCDGEVVNGPEVTIDMAKKEAWHNNAKWKNLPDLMLAYRASAFFARIHTPESLMGLHLAEENEDSVKQ